MMDNCRYNKIKLLYKLSCLCWFIDKHAMADAKKEGEDECIRMLEELKSDIDKHIERLDRLLCEPK